MARVSKYVCSGGTPDRDGAWSPLQMNFPMAVFHCTHYKQCNFSCQHARGWIFNRLCIILYQLLMWRDLNTVDNEYLERERERKGWKEKWEEAEEKERERESHREEGGKDGGYWKHTCQVKHHSGLKETVKQRKRRVRDIWGKQTQAVASPWMCVLGYNIIANIYYWSRNKIDRQ